MAQILPLDVEVACELRILTEGVDPEVTYQITRLCERAQQFGYHNGYIRGMTDGWTKRDRQQHNQEKTA